MNKLFIVCFCLFLITSCTEHYNIVGNSNVPIFDNKTLHLKTPSEGLEVKDQDSAKVIHGKFKFNGDIDSVVFAQIYLNNECVMPIVLENGNITISVDNIGQKVSGGPLNDKLYALFKEKDRIDNKMWNLQQKAITMMKAGFSMEDIDRQLSKKIERLNLQSTALETKFIIDNGTNVLGPGFFMMICQKYPSPIITTQINEILTGVPESFYKHPYVSAYLSSAIHNPKSKPLCKKAKQIVF